MSILAHFEEPVSGGERRGFARRKLRLELERSGSAGAPGRVLVHDLSATGLLMETASRVSRAATIEIEIPEVGATEASIVWNSGNFYGCKFNRPLPKSALAAALLKARSPEVGSEVRGGGALAEIQALSARVQELTEQLDTVIAKLEKKRRD